MRAAIRAPSAVPADQVRDRLIVALDLPNATAAGAMVGRLGETVSFYKIGMELVYGGEGLALAARLIAAGNRIFIDLKLHDIPNTVERATRQIARLGATFLTVHAYPQTMRAAKAGAADSGLKILGVSVLTSSDDTDLQEAGYAYGVRDLVARRARQAREAGIDGLILSPQELQETRQAVGHDLLLVTPGIRAAGGAVGDQKRIMSPARAIHEGADYLVIGRPVTEASDPQAAAAAIAEEIAGTQAS
ncbi:MAG: orotidine-5-phosphate decarboxylase [Methylobacteriaceae bacterium]|nr:orotidine-5-phosphate decarboxylase [Methylobacteriaceae bacterium]